MHVRHGQVQIGHAAGKLPREVPLQTSAGNARAAELCLGRKGPTHLTFAIGPKSICHRGKRNPVGAQGQIVFVTRHTQVQIHRGVHGRAVERELEWLHRHVPAVHAHRRLPMGDLDFAQIELPDVSCHDEIFQREILCRRFLAATGGFRCGLGRRRGRFIATLRTACEQIIIAGHVQRIGGELEVPADRV